MLNRSPSFKGLRPSSELASRIKRSNSHSNTSPELQLRRELWRLGLRYRKNLKTLPGKPDIVFRKARIVVFCDGDFWHGRNWDLLRQKLLAGNNPGYWTSKISTNITRDKRNTELLRLAGWTVVRIWESEIRDNLSEIAMKIKNEIDFRLKGSTS